MAYEQKPGTVTIFKNNKKQNENQPDYTGTAKTDDGQEFKISLWVKNGKNGDYFSGAIKPPFVPDGSRQQQTITQEPIGDNDDLPF